MFRDKYTKLPEIRLLAESVYSLMKRGKIPLAAREILRREAYWSKQDFFTFFDRLIPYIDSHLPQFMELLDSLGQQTSRRISVSEIAMKLLREYLFSDSSIEDDLVQTMLFALRHASADCIAQYIYSDYNYNADLNVMKVLKQLSAAQQKQMIEALIPVSIDKFNVRILHFLSALNPDYFFEQLFELEGEKINIAAVLLSIWDDRKREAETNALQTFAYQPDRIDHESGLLTCAQIQSRKKYYFMATLLREFHQLSRYIAILKLANKPLRERFIVGGGHWVSGDIRIDADGKCECLIIDPMGAEKNDVLGEYNDHMRSGIGSMIRLAARYFRKLTIYYAVDKRQYDNESCKVFALDDVVHLHTIEHFLLQPYHESGLFSYLAAQKDAQTWIDNKDGLVVKSCHLPLSLERLKQSRKLFTNTFPARSSEELSRPINKKGETAVDSARKYFKYSTNYNKLINIRAAYKFEKIGLHNAFYFSEHSLAEIEQAKQQFNLAGCCLRLLGKPLSELKHLLAYAKCDLDDKNITTPKRCIPL